MGVIPRDITQLAKKNSLKRLFLQVVEKVVSTAFFYFQSCEKSFIIRRKGGVYHDGENGK